MAVTLTADMAHTNSNRSSTKAQQHSGHISRLDLQLLSASSHNIRHRHR